MELEKALLHSLYPPETLEKYTQISSLFPKKPLVSIIAGSGWGQVVKGREVVVLSYQEIGFPFHREVEGHPGVVRLVEENGIPFLVFEGRLHLYQGYHYRDSVLPVIFSFLCGAKTLICTNAAGSLHRSVPPGVICLLVDQIDFTFIPDPPTFLKRPFFSEKLRNIMHEVVKKKNVPIVEGTYVGVLGPSFETPAEIRMFARFGTVIGMSTVKEVKVANNLGLPVCGISLVTNWGSGLAHIPLSHQEVLTTSTRLKPLLGEILGAFIQEVAHEWT
ncbi:MAG: purine-nucleoside phosphorylase [Candidatus Caldatribacteriaceae bacterium]